MCIRDRAIFTNFKNIVDSTSPKLPFGIAQIGKAFRNEITPRNFIFRVREFEQMELEFFVKPGTDEEWHNRWVADRLDWWERQGIPKDAIELLVVPGVELAPYSKATTDLMYRFPHGLEELEGIANRTDFDLGSHTKNQEEFEIKSQVKDNKDSNNKLAVHDLGAKKWEIPFVIEPSAGVDRGVLAVLNEAFKKESLEDGSERVVMQFKPHLAPIKAAVLPLKRNNEDIVSKARQIKRQLSRLGLGRIVYEDTGNIGKGYRRHDEAGTPFCITIDFQTIEQDGTVTIRNRDTMKQERVSEEGLAAFMLNHISNLPE